MYTIIIALLACFLSFPTLAWSQTGDTGVGDSPPGAGLGDEEEQPINSPYPGALGQVDNREPHAACRRCFTIPGDGDGYTIWESVRVGKDSEFLIRRMLENPAPLEDGEERPTVDDAGEPLWYIGKQAFSGPQDTELLGDTDFTLIEVKRVRHRHEPLLMAIPGVHGVGIVDTGISVYILPDHDTSDIPATLDGIPVEIFIEGVPDLLSHDDVRFRPVPVGAGIFSAEPGIYMTPVSGGTLGPHITREVGSGYQVWSLTAAHVVRHYPDDPLPDPGVLPIYQPDVAFGNLYGKVAHLFQLEPCGSLSQCRDYRAPVNLTHIDPDIAAIDPEPFDVIQYSPYNDPTGTDPIRRLTLDHDSYRSGPSGVLRTATSGDEVKIWGAYGGPKTGEVAVVGRTISAHLEGGQHYKMCCLSGVDIDGAEGVRSGDSGAAVTYKSTGNRHVVGVNIAGSHSQAWFIESWDIKDAFDRADVEFAHYWGTKSGYRKPATTTCDGGC